MDKVETIVSKRLYRIHDPLEKLSAVFSAWADILDSEYVEYMEIVLDFWAEGVRKGEDSWKIDLNRFYAENIAVLDSILSDCVAKGEIKPVNTKLIASTMLGALDGMLIQWVTNRDVFDIKEAAQLFVGTMIEGLKKEK